MMAGRQVTLGKLLHGLVSRQRVDGGVAELAPVTASLTVESLALDSRRVAPGGVFVALAGDSVDGKDFIARALASGAVAVLVDLDDLRELSTLAVPLVGVQQLAQQLSELASRFYAKPSAHLQLIGITGTNGKTTCSQLLAQLVSRLHKSAAVVGTLGYGVVGEPLQETGFTTPDAIAAQSIVAQMLEQGVELLAMEVSSHSLQQHRVGSLEFDVAVFTNLSRDHLDYHGDMQAYGRAKQQLFSMATVRTAIINLDDTCGRRIAAKLPETVDAIGYSLSDGDAAVFAREIEYSASGISAYLSTPWGEGELRSQLLGEFNLRNLLAVIASACVSDLALDDVLAAVPQLQSVAGRMQRVAIESGIESDIDVVVDYAHTPDALQQSLQALKAHAANDLWCVFGCGGDRDRGKRAQMAAAAERYADHIVVTHDNPRSEEPAQIFADIATGFSHSECAQFISSRGEAITTALQQARAGDLVLLAGKGHEDYQLIGSEKLAFSDLVQAREALQQRLENSRGVQR